MNKAELRRIADNVNRAKKEREATQTQYEQANSFEQWKSQVLLDITNGMRDAAFKGCYEYRYWLKEPDPRCRNFILREFSDYTRLEGETIILSWSKDEDQGTV